VPTSWKIKAPQAKQAVAVDTGNHWQWCRLIVERGVVEEVVSEALKFKDDDR